MTEDSGIRPDGTLILDEDVALPEPLDILIVGGGPGGTAAAFRAKELGLSALVIDADDLMKRIRDYPKGKPILPDFGPVDGMKFPKAGPLVDRLHFAPIDKDAMHEQWKALYRRHGVPAMVGVELTGLERDASGLCVAKAWNYNLKSAQTFLARHMILALGRGVPRRFDIPGNTDGIAFRLADAASYVGAPACVIGGGTSAAEAVIAISGAKTAASDGTHVYWSYHGDKMPRVSRALADAFFQAYVGNGNVRYQPHSEPVAVVVADDNQEYLAIQIDRKVLSGRPQETLHVEFPKCACVACIGEDVPEAFLASLGIHMIVAGDRKKKAAVVTPLLETEQPNVHLIGDTLSDHYFVTEEFPADTANLQMVARPGNIKAAMRDAVLVVEVIRQKREGRELISVELEFAENPPGAPREEKAAEAVAAVATAVAKTEGPPKASFEAGRGADEVVAYLVRILPGGVEETQYPVKRDAVTSIGRKGAAISIPEDSMLSDAHASIAHGRDGFLLRDDGGETGVFLRLQPGEDVEITPGSLLRAGQQFLAFEVREGKARVEHFNRDGVQVGTYELTKRMKILGRGAPDVDLDPNDATLSKRHLSASFADGRIVVADLVSTNGTLLKIDLATKLRDGDEFRVGKQLFRLKAREANATTLAMMESAVVVPTTPEAKTQYIKERTAILTAPKAPPKECAVTFGSGGKTVPATVGQTVLEVAQRNGIEIEAQCYMGVCCSDPIRVLSGIENLDERGKDEAKHLAERGYTDPSYRFACVAKLKGPVTVEIVAAE